MEITFAVVAVLYEEVKYHSRQKHAFLKAYLRVWVENVGGNKGPNSPSLSLIDLFASTGWCKNQDGKETWPGTSILLAECMSLYPSSKPKALFFNSFNPSGGKAQDDQMASLKAAVSAFNPRPKCDIMYCSEPIERAWPRAAQAVNLNFPSLWILDPYKPQHLPWEIVENIANLKAPNYPRRPELFINLMTASLQQNIDNAPHLLNIALGLPEVEWRPRIDEMRADGLNTREAIRDLYAERLTNIYGKRPYAIEVDGVEGNIVYVIFFCTDHAAGFHMLRTLVDEKFAEWRIKTWKPRANEIKAFRQASRKAAKSGQKQAKLFD